MRISDWSSDVCSSDLMDADQKLQPALAKSWEATDDTTWTFKLDEKAKFSNGEPFTAQDVVFSFCRILNNETGIGSGGTNTVRRILSVETPDERTVLLKTAAPQPVLLNELARIDRKRTRLNSSH